MPNLTSKMESFIQTMLKGEEFTRHGFNLLVKREAPEQHFDALAEAGFFEPANNPGPAPSNDPGFVQIPYWSALSYLKAVAKRSRELNDEQLANKIIRIISATTTFRDDNGESRDNYHTYREFAEIFGLLPLEVITQEDILLARIWLSSRYDNALAGIELGNGLLRRFLANGKPEDIERACLLMRECMAFEWLPEKNARGRDLVTKIDNYWLKEIVDNYAKDLGSKGGLVAVRIFEDGLRTIFSDSRRGYGTTLFRAAIEDNSQNTDFRGPENRFIDGARNALAGWVETGSSEAASHVEKALHDESDIVKRIAIHTVTEYFESFRTSFEDVIDAQIFSSENRHELYRLLEKRYSELTPSGKDKIISSIKAIPKPKSGEELERRLKFIQREWLTAIKDQPEAAEWFKALNSDPSLGPATDHPDFLSYSETRWGPGPTPFSKESLLAFAEDGTIVDRLNEFKETNSWKGPTLGGLISELEATVAASPNIFLPLLSNFHSAKIAFQHALISGFKLALDPSQAEKSPLDWDVAWPKIIDFFSECLSDEAFWNSKSEEKDNFNPTRSWMTTLIADFLEAGTRDDKTAYSPNLLPKGWELIKILVERAPEDNPDLADPMTRALNTEKGRAVAAMYNHALRSCRVAQQEKKSLQLTWKTLQPTFDMELAKCRNANFEFSTLSASYIANIDYMSHDWLAHNVKSLFPAEFPVNFKAALGGLAYATPTRAIYKILQSNDILGAGLQAKLEDSNSRERIIEWICLAYLWGDESLNGTLMSQIFLGGSDDLQNASQFFRHVRGQNLTSEQIELVLAFWEKCLNWSRAQPELPTHLLSRLGQLASYINTLDDRANGLLFDVVPYVHIDYSGDEMVRDLARLADTNSTIAVNLLERMFEKNSPNYDMDNKLKELLHKLANNGHRTTVLRIIEKLRKTLPGMIEFYKQIVADSPPT